MSNAPKPPEKDAATILAELKAPFDPRKIHWRVGSTSQDKKRGMALAYCDARDIMIRLDDVVGPLNWQCRYPWSEGGRLVCEIGIRFGDEWIWKSNGAGDTQVEAEKGAFSDAFKRAAVMFGIGRYLYMLPSPWLDLDERRQLKTRPELPAWATPEGYWARVNKRDAA